jgi:hypothetical protein
MAIQPPKKKAECLKCIVNSKGELGIRVGRECFFIIDGRLMQYNESHHHESGAPIQYRQTVAGEFIGAIHPASWANAASGQNFYSAAVMPTAASKWQIPKNLKWRPLPINK